MPGPKIVVVQDLDKPGYVGSWWGEVNSNTHRALGCVGTITDGCVRDVDEMTNAGFKALAARLCVGHAHAAPAKWGCEVEVFGRCIQPGQLIHADKHGFLAIPPGEERHLLEASLFMDRNECETVIPAARSASGLSTEELLEQLKAGGKIDATLYASTATRVGNVRWYGGSAGTLTLSALSQELDESPAFVSGKEAAELRHR